MNQKSYLCIDLKSFYASIECVERGLDPMTANLVVADLARSEKTICLAITPAMKKLGIRNRCRIFEIPPNVKYIAAPPRMKKYIDYSADIYAIYLKYISKDDIHVYSIDEAFLDVTDYLELYHMTPRELGGRIMDDIYSTFGIRATCGIGTNLYLAKIALDITAKRNKDFIGELTEESYQKTLWNHKPLTDFWRIGPGTAKKLANYGIYTMGDIANANEEFLYRLLGVDAELLIDHAWGKEPTTIADIKSYHSKSNSLTSGQVLMRDYEFEEGKLIVKEMMDLLCLDMVDKNLMTKSITLHIGYSNQLHMNPAHGTVSLDEETNADRIILPAIASLYERIVNPNFPIRRVTLSCNNVIPEEYHQYSFFLDAAELERNRKMQKAVLEIKNKFGKNAILKGMNLEEGAMTRERNHQIGGHKSGE
ncbi:MAG: DNA repair protein [Clostridiales bacterium]|nr:DNA repair protein [Roseburia sp.]MDD7636507.1 DNA repair protein [Clostridiales bacterium]MDY4111406.1 DNA repair protein [Roseburia sp.]